MSELYQPVQGPYPRSPPGPPWVVERACAGAYPRTLAQIPPAGRLSCVVRPFSRPRLPGTLLPVTFGPFFYGKNPPGCFLDEYFCHQNLDAQAAPDCARREENTGACLSCWGDDAEVISPLSTLHSPLFPQAERSETQFRRKFFAKLSYKKAEEARKVCSRGLSSSSG